MGSEAEDKISSRRRKNLQRGYMLLLLLFAFCGGCGLAFHLLWGVNTVSWSSPSIRPGNIALYLCKSGYSQDENFCKPVGLDVVHGLEDLKLLTSQHYPCKVLPEADISNECRLFDPDGMEITEEGQLSKLANGTRLAVVKGDNHFFWPTVKIGHRWICNGS